MKRQRGVISIEFGLGAVVLFMGTFAIFEACRLIYIVNLTETALRESARDTRVVESTDYNARFQEVFANSGKVWSMLADVERYTLAVDYYADYDALISDQGQQNCQTCPIAQYSLSYRYTPVTFTTAGERDITRRILVQQEHQGWPQ